MADTARNLEATERWERHYNECDVERMVHDCYAPDCVVDVKGWLRLRGHDTFLTMERAVLDVAPRRYMDVERRLAADDTVVVQAVLRDPDRGAEWQTPFCAVLHFRDGAIALDETYLDWNLWPAPELTPDAVEGLDIEVIGDIGAGSATAGAR